MRPLLVTAIVLAGCGGNPENSAVCGFTSIAASSLILQGMSNVHALLREPPPELEGPVPARVVGYGTSRAIAAVGPEGAVLGYEGQGFPQMPGFGLVLIDDSSEVFRGVLIYDTDLPSGYPQIGTISGPESTIPLLGTRVNWGSVNDVRCPLFAELAAVEH